MAGLDPAEATVERVYDTRIIDIMKSEGLAPGAKLEVILSKDAVWYNGRTPAPTHNMEGYEKFDDVYFDKDDLRPSQRIVGIVHDIEKRTGRIVLAPSVPENKQRGYDRGVFFVQNDVIADYKIN